MRVDAISTSTTSVSNANRLSTSGTTNLDPKLELTHSIQSTFSAILASVGREGYASADPITSGTQFGTGADARSSKVTITGSDAGAGDSAGARLDDSAVAGWEQWFETVGRTRYSDYVQWKNTTPETALAPAETFKESYSGILRDAYAHGGYANPKEFLAGLSSERLHDVQQVHRLADPIQVDGLSEEGALNLLLPPCAAVDSNQDGLTAVGQAMTIGFPDSNTPRDIRDAWDAATANLPEDEVAMRSLQMKMPLLLANIHINQDGKYTGQAEPGDADWVNPMADAEYSYRKAAQGWLSYLDAFKNQIPPEQYSHDQSFWSDFLGRLPDDFKPTLG